VFNPVEWIVDTGSSSIICSNQSLFQEHQKVADDEGVFIGNSSAVKKFGEGKISLRLTSKKICLWVMFCMFLKCVGT